MSRYTIRVDSWCPNFNKYTLCDDHGCVVARVDAQTWGDFQPSAEQAGAAFRLLVPGADIEMRLNEEENHD